MDWEKGVRNSLGSASVPVSGFGHNYMDATALFMLIAFVLRPLVVLMQLHLEVAGDGFETRQSMRETLQLHGCWSRCWRGEGASAPSWLDGSLECV